MIELMRGSIFESTAEVIAHQVNCQGVMGAGLAKQIKDKFPEVYEAYHGHCLEYNKDANLLLGSVFYQPVKNKKLCIANLFAQNNFGCGCQTDYSALRNCLDNINKACHSRVAIPYKLGCGLAGGDWENVVYPIIQRIFRYSNTVLEIWKPKSHD